MSLDHLLLGLLRTPASGYDLKAIFDQRIGYFWAAELSQIYPTLQRMEKKGWLKSHKADAKRGAGRRVYETTARGHRALQAWLESGPEVGDERFAYLGQVYVMDELEDLEQTLRFFHRLRDHFAPRLEALRLIERRWAERHPGLPDTLNPSQFHIYLTLRKGLISLAANVEWCEESIRRVETRLTKENQHGGAISRPALDSHRGRYRSADRILDSNQP